MTVNSKINKINNLMDKVEKEVNKMCNGRNCKPEKAVRKSKVKNSKVEAEQQVNV
jgi:hypothetical protein